MADIDIYRAVLPRGIRLDTYRLPQDQSEEGESPYSIAEGSAEDSEALRNSYGAVEYPISFESDSGFQYTLPNSPLIRVEGMKHIVSTKIAGGSRGSVKELVAVDDLKVMIRGVVFTERGNGSAVGGDAYPYDELKRMVSLFKANESLKVASALLEAWEISRVVVERFNVPATPGLNGAFYYELDCLSDTDEEIIIVDSQ